MLALALTLAALQDLAAPSPAELNGGEEPGRAAKNSVQLAGFNHVAKTPDGVLHVEGELLVGWEEGTPMLDREAAVTQVGGQLGRRFGGRLSHVVQLPEGTRAQDARARFAALPGVRYAELNGIGEAMLCRGGTNDPLFPDQWHLENTSSNSGVPGADIEAVAAWTTTTGSSSVVLAVLDTGIGLNHPEFAGRLLPGIDTFYGDNDPSEESGFSHGTPVAALAAANSNNGNAVAGVDHHCRILPVKVLSDLGYGTVEALADGLDFAVQQNADVVNMSLGNYPPQQALIDALGDARAAGVILIASAGNGGTGNADQSWPGASPDTISIGASNASDRRAWYSGTGAALDFIAPGHLTWTVTRFGTTEFSGTSAAAPVVAGIVTLLLSVTPGLTQDDVYLLLRAGSEDQVGGTEDPLGRDDRFGHGRVNAAQSLRAINVPLRYCDAIPNSTGVPATIEFLGSTSVADDDFGLRASSLPPMRTALFVLGSQRASTLIPTPRDMGRLCVGGNAGRFMDSVQTADAAGQVVHRVNLTSLPLAGRPAVAAGERWCFQVWYRDSLLGIPVSNFSQAIEVPFQ